MRRVTPWLTAFALAITATGAAADVSGTERTIIVSGHAATVVPAGANGATRRVAYNAALRAALVDAAAKARLVADVSGVDLGAVQAVFEQSDHLVQRCRRPRQRRCRVIASVSVTYGIR